MQPRAVNNASFAELLQRHRAAAELTQEELAERAGVSARSISDLERGITRRPYSHTVQRLTRALGLSGREASRFEQAARRIGRAVEGTTAVQQEIPHPPVYAIATQNLPLQPTTFIGRRHEVETVAGMLQREDVRLLTLTGPGGVGKTRLALRAAEDVLDAFADGVIFVSLASLVDPELVPSAISTACGVTEGNGRALLEALTGHLRSRQTLIVIDNFEHLLSAADTVSHLLVTCPQLSILVTSRALLHLAAEHHYPVPLLPVPIPLHLPARDVLSGYDAVQLFVQRAQARIPDFQFTDENAGTVAEICSRLDGLPLAIELAAARVQVFPPDILLEQLGNRLGVLIGGPRDQPTRQQTLRKTLDWSYELLTEQEQELFSLLTIFAGGFTLTAVEAAWKTGGEADTLAGITGLVEQSLVHQMEAEEPRFLMLETIREYAAEKLDGMEQERDFRNNHARFFLDLAEEADPHLIAPEQGEWLTRLDRELDNIRVALRWFLDNQAIDEGLCLAATLDRYWHTRGYLNEERQWLEEGLERGPGDIRVRARTLWTLGRISWLQGDLERAAVLLEEALALYRNLEDRRGIARTLNLLGNTFGYGGQYERSRLLHEESLRLWRELGELRESARPLQNLGRAAAGHGDLASGRQHIAEALKIYRAVGDMRGIAQTLINLGWIAVQEDDLAEAKSRTDEALALSRTLGARQWIVNALLVLSTVERKQGYLERAAEHLREALMLCRGVGQADVSIASLEEAAALALARTEAERAVCIKGAITAICEGSDDGVPSADLLERDSVLSGAKAMLEEDEFIRAWRQGHAMSLEEAVAYAADEGTASAHFRPFLLK